jgi:autotransporter-associated beta strand protein
MFKAAMIRRARSLICLSAWLLAAGVAFANIPGGGTGTGPNVTLTDNGTTVTLANGIASIVVTKADASIHTINYTYNNSGTTVTNQLLANGNNGGQLYWTGNPASFGTMSFTESVVANNANYAEIALLSTSTTNGTMEVHFSMLRGSPGFYTSVILNHRSQDDTVGIVLRPNIYAGAIFNWMSVDAARNKLMEVQPTAGSVGVLGAPVECYLWTNGIYQGRYDDKYKYSAELGAERVWGWSSVGTGGANVGIWNISASVEDYPGGPMERSLMEHIGTTILNVFTGGYYGFSTDNNIQPGELWSKTYGPYFYYFNNITNSITATNQAAQALYSDALAQAAAETPAWPYSWFTNSNYAPTSNRGTVTGQMAINDIDNPNASAAGLWVGLVQQPSTTYDSVYDFQQWCRPYEFWTKTDANGYFTVSNVIAGGNYTLYAFGPGAAGTFLSQNQTGGNPPLICDVPSSPFSVTVTATTTNNLGQITWTPTRMGPTVFEIGYPDRTAGKFRHGEDYWVGDIGPSPTDPMPIWSKWLEYPFDFPNGLNYTVGQSRWSTDWSFIQPVVTDSSGNYNPSTSTINFYLPAAPANGATASFYLGLCSDYYSAVIVSVNNVNLGNISGRVGSPNNSLPTTGYYAEYASSDGNIREGNNGAFTDERLNFPGSALKAGWNTISISFREIAANYFADHLMYDYVRLELTGYEAPAPGSVSAYAGNNGNLVCWPVTPGATSYNVYSTTTSGSGYTLVAGGVTGPLCGSGSDNASYVDTTAVNGTTYYYVVQSVNPTGTSANSPESLGVTPSADISTSVPAAPTGLTVSSAVHHSVTLNWSASAGADFYTIYRSTLYDNGGGASNTLNTIILDNTNTGTSYPDTSPTDGSLYSYSVTATSAGGTSANSPSAVAVPLPSPPASAPGSFAGSFSGSAKTNIVLNWSPVSGAVGYIVWRSSGPTGPFNYVMSITETTYTDSGVTTNSSYYYEVAAVNSGGVSTNATAIVLGQIVAPGLNAIPGDGQVSLSWNATPESTNYVLQSSTTSGGSYTTILVTNTTSFVNSNLVDGTTYYYVIYAEGPYGQSPVSSQTAVTPSVNAGAAIYWTNTITGTAQNWNTVTNWLNDALFPNGAQSVAVVNSAISGNQTIDLNQTVVVGSLSLGSGGGIYTLAPAGGTLAFNNSPAAATLIELSTSLGDTLSAPITINGTLLVSNTTANTLTFSGNISSGSVNLTGNTYLSGTDTYTGGTTENAGRLTFSAAGTIPSSGTLTLNGTGSVLVPPANSLPNVLINGTNSITGNGNSGTGIATLNDSGRLTLLVSGGSAVFDLTGSMSGSGTLVLGTAAMTLRFNGTGGDGNALFNLNTNTAVAIVRATGTTAIALGGLMGGPRTELQGDNSATGANMTYTIGGANANTEFDGLITNGTVGTVALLKTGSGTLTLTNGNGYSAGTTINGGTLLINNTRGSGTGSGFVNVNSGGALAGRGIISGAVTVNSGGSLVPGNPSGTLTITNALTLGGGSTTYLQVQHSPLTNTVVKVAGGGTINEGGTLNVTNANATVFGAGDAFLLFNAVHYSGAFTNFILPPLTAGLEWNTSALGASGTLSVVAVSSPIIGTVSFSGGNLVVSGTGGTANWPFYVLAATNLASPVWVPVLTNQFDATGNFSVTNPVDPSSQQSFYKLQLQ